jgi:hypothetical protein
MDLTFVSPQNSFQEDTMSFNQIISKLSDIQSLTVNGIGPDLSAYE